MEGKEPLPLRVQLRIENTNTVNMCLKPLALPGYSCSLAPDSLCSKRLYPKGFVNPIAASGVILSDCNLVQVTSATSLSQLLKRRAEVEESRVSQNRAEQWHSKHFQSLPGPPLTQ